MVDKYVFETLVWPDWTDEWQDVVVEISSTPSSSKDGLGFSSYLAPTVYLLNDTAKRDIWDSLNDDQKSDIEDAAFLACGYCK